MANRRKIIGKLWKFGTRIANRHKRRSTRETLKTKEKKHELKYKIKNWEIFLGIWKKEQKWKSNYWKLGKNRKLKRIQVENVE